MIVALELLAVIGYFIFFVSMIGRGVTRFLSHFHRPNVFVQMNYPESHRDPTRPNFTEDESAAWLNVTAKMEQFERRAIQGRKNGS